MARLRWIELETEGVDGMAELIRAAVGGTSMTLPTAPRVESPAGPALIEAPQVSVAAPPVRPVAAKGKTARKNAPSAAAPKTPASRPAPGGGDTISARILEALEKRPLSSLELSQALHLEPAQVYGACHTLKKSGVIESRNNTEDGTRRYFLAKR